MPQPLLLGLIGHPLSHSLSPKLHGAALKHAGIEGEYQLFDIETPELETKLSDLIANGLNGFNVTIPHKVQIFESAHKLTADAALVGAVNTVKIEKDGSLTGHNTDANGLLEAFKEFSTANLKGQSGLLIGCGGSAQAVLKVASDLGLAKIDVVGRDESKVERFISAGKERFSKASSDLEKAFAERIGRHKKAQASYQVVFNTTPIGLKHDDEVPGWMTELAKEFPGDATVMDLVYHKDLSAPAFAKLTSSLGLATADGINMLVHQARLAFEFWTGVSVPAEVMKASLSQP